MEKQNTAKGISIFLESNNTSNTHTDAASPASNSPQAKVYIHPELSYPDFMQLLSTLMLHGMNAYLAVYKNQIKQMNKQQLIKFNQVNPKDKTHATPVHVLSESELDAACLEATYSIHDLANLTVSNVLKMFLPDELAFLNPEELISAEAILRAEETCLNEALGSLTDSQRKIAEERLKALKTEIKAQKDALAKKLFESEQTNHAEDTNNSTTSDNN